MPYSRNADLPEAVRNALPADAQAIWRNAFNSVEERTKDEGRAAAGAWAAVKRAGWEKNEEGEWVKKEFQIAKLDSDRHLVFGWANVSIRKDGEQIEDHQGDLIDPEDLEDAAYVFNLQFRKTGVMHQGEAKGDLIESLVVTPEKLEAMGLEKSALPVGWWVGFHVPDDDVFAKVKDGTFAMFSVQGRAVREKVD